ncbi:Uncharacterized protein APZ42_027451 [Daphnia magna]|uniref:Uncharacterized protein n=1 Tax=Daphnia magna TaxID=35525 RepID=A0A164RLM3_9CRUS|nr:Uncharacterized protein APZ42_027451 [Daphnia magna]
MILFFFKEERHKRDIEEITSALVEYEITIISILTRISTEKKKKKKGKMINREKEEHLIERWADNRLEQKQNTGIVGSK